MKIASSGIGTVASAQGFNAKSAFPYQWAWNFAGQPVGEGVIAAVQHSSVTAVPTGVRWDITGADPYVDCYDAGATTAKISGDLNATDKNAYYMHSLFDFSGSASIQDNLASSGGTANLSKFDLYWFSSGSGATNYEGSNAINEFKMSNGVTVLVHDLRGTNGRYGSDGIEYQGTAGDWVNRTLEEPIQLENYFNGIGTDGQNIIHHGYILADRILSESDIGSLPVDISKARS